MEIANSDGKLAETLIYDHFRPDPLDFDRKCDGSLPLEELLKPNAELRNLLQDIDRSKARVWGLTNAYHTVKCFILCDAVGAYRLGV